MKKINLKKIFLGFILLITIGIGIIFFLNKGVIYGGLGLYYLDNGNQEKGLKFLDKGIKYADDKYMKGNFYYIKGINLYLNGKKDEGVKAFYKAIDNGFEDGLMFGYLGEYLGKKGKYYEAIDFFDKSIKILENIKFNDFNIDDKSYLGEFYYYRGGAYAGLGMYGKSILDYDVAIKLDPKNNKYYFYYKGQALKAMGNIKEGNIFLEKSKKLGKIN